MDSLYIVMPAYNEEANIEGVVRQWYPVLAGKSEASRLVIADSGSNDRTHEVLENLPKGDSIEFKYDDRTRMKLDLVDVLGRQPAAIGVVGNLFFAKVSA